MRVLWLLPFALLACAHADGVADRQIEDLRRGVDQTEAEQDRVNARAAMIGETPDERAARPVYPAPKPVERPQRSVQIGEDETPNDDPDDPEARPEIRLQGNGVAAPRPSRKSRRADDEPTTTTPSRKKRGDASDSAAPKENR